MTASEQKQWNRIKEIIAKNTRMLLEMKSRGEKPATTWKFNPPAKACKYCQELGKHTFVFKPERAHPNCKCTLVEKNHTSDNSKKNAQNNNVKVIHATTTGKRQQSTLHTVLEGHHKLQTQPQEFISSQTTPNNSKPINPNEFILPAHSSVLTQKWNLPTASPNPHFDDIQKNREIESAPSFLESYIYEQIQVDISKRYQTAPFVYNKTISDPEEDKYYSVGIKTYNGIKSILHLLPKIADVGAAASSWLPKNFGLGVDMASTVLSLLPNFEHLQLIKNDGTNFGLIEEKIQSDIIDSYYQVENIKYKAKYIDAAVERGVVIPKYNLTLDHIFQMTSAALKSAFINGIQNKLALDKKNEPLAKVIKQAELMTEMVMENVDITLKDFPGTESQVYVHNVIAKATEIAEQNTDSVIFGVKVKYTYSMPESYSWASPQSSSYKYKTNWNSIMRKF